MRRIGFDFTNYPTAKYYFDNFEDWQHEYMAGEFFEDIVEGLKKIYGTKYIDEEYKALVWSGLHNTEKYKSLSESEKERITFLQNKIKENCDKSCIE